MDDWIIRYPLGTTERASERDVRLRANVGSLPEGCAVSPDGGKTWVSPSALPSPTCTGTANGHTTSDDAALRSPEENFRYAQFLERSDSGRDETSRALVHYEIAAARGHVGAQRTLGDIYRTGCGVDRSPRRAAHWYAMAAEEGDEASKKHLAALGVSSEWDPANPSDLQDLRDKAELGDASAQTRLAWCLKNGVALERDPKAAVWWYERAAVQGDVSAQSSLGVMYETSAGVNRSVLMAIQWYTRAAERGDAVGQYLLAAVYDRGDSIARDMPSAVKWYEAAAESGCEEAQVRLGQIYASGDGVEANSDRSAMWFSRAAVQGNGVAREHMAGVRSPRVVAKNVSVTSSQSKAANPRNRLYNDTSSAPLSVEPSPAAMRASAVVAKHVEAEALRGNEAAQCLLGSMYCAGNGVNKDVARGVRLLNMAAAKGSAEAAFRLGDMYRTGQRVVRNNSEAVKWLERAGELGHDLAVWDLVCLLWRGETSASRVRAFAWACVAEGRSPHTYAQESARMRRKRTFMLDRLSTVEIAEGQHLARQLVAQRPEVGEGRG